MISSEYVKRLLLTISQDRKDCRALLVLLDEQRRLLIERQTQALEDVNQQLGRLYQKMAKSSAERQSCLTQLNVEPNAQGINRLIDCLPEAYQTQARTIWDDLLSTTVKCKQINERNALLLNMQREILAPLIGQEADYIYTG